jgi:hypothetical protein
MCVGVQHEESSHKFDLSLYSLSVELSLCETHTKLYQFSLKRLIVSNTKYSLHVQDLVLKFGTSSHTTEFTERLFTTTQCYLHGVRYSLQE